MTQPPDPGSDQGEPGRLARRGRWRSAAAPPAPPVRATQWFDRPRWRPRSPVGRPPRRRGQFSYETVSPPRRPVRLEDTSADPGTGPAPPVRRCAAGTGRPGPPRWSGPARVDRPPDRPDRRPVSRAEPRRAPARGAALGRRGPRRQRRAAPAGPGCRFATSTRGRSSSSPACLRWRCSSSGCSPSPRSTASSTRPARSARSTTPSPRSTVRVHAAGPAEPGLRRRDRDRRGQHRAVHRAGDDRLGGLQPLRGPHRRHRGDPVRARGLSAASDRFGGASGPVRLLFVLAGL